jgi:RNA polymerase sigma factor (sigma-70 family)
VELDNSTIVRTRSDEGEQARVLEIFEEHRTRLTIQAYRLTHSWVDAEDVVQGAWIRWAAHCATVTAPTSWLYRVTSNIAIDHLRKNARRRESFTTEIGDMTSAGSDPHAVIELQEDVCAGVRILLESLSSLERAVFVIRRVGRCSHIETAMALRRSLPPSGNSTAVPACISPRTRNDSQYRMRRCTESRSSSCMPRRWVNWSAWSDCSPQRCQYMPSTQLRPRAAGP